jgi:hypothetical protein
MLKRKGREPNIYWGHVGMNVVPLYGLGFSPNMVFFSPWVNKLCTHLLFLK